MATEIQRKLQGLVNTEIKYADKTGSSKLSTCDHSGWDKDVWYYKDQIIEAIRNRGYNVSVSRSWGVTDIVTTPKIILE